MKFECVGVEITLSNERSFVLTCLYRHPFAKMEFYDQLKPMLNSLGPNKQIIILGDFNVNWDENKAEKNLERTTENYKLQQLIEQSTRLTNK